MNHLFQKFVQKNPFPLELGGELPELEIAYWTAGKLNAKKDNVIWICHALTANADPSDWWKGLVGETDFFNPKDYFLICANMLGSPYGSSSALSTNPETNEPYYADFHRVTVRDMARAWEILRNFLEIEKIHTVIGGSMGGQQAMEWAIQQPDRFENMIVLATNAKHSAWGIAFNESQHMAIKADPTWDEKRYDAGQEGLKAARSIALLSYRNYDTYNATQKEQNEEVTENFKVQSYQHYQGKKLVDRFNVHCYLTLSDAMNTHNVGRGRGSLEKALSKIKARTLVIGIVSDFLFPIEEQDFLAKNIKGASLVRIDSSYGHDGFLVETEKISRIIADFLTETEKKSLKLEIKQFWKNKVAF